MTVPRCPKGIPIVYTPIPVWWMAVPRPGSRRAAVTARAKIASATRTPTAAMSVGTPFVLTNVENVVAVGAPTAARLPLPPVATDVAVRSVSVPSIPSAAPVSGIPSVLQCVPMNAAEAAKFASPTVVTMSVDPTAAPASAVFVQMAITAKMGPVLRSVCPPVLVVNAVLTVAT
jgi:hypothetical protein